MHLAASSFIPHSPCLCSSTAKLPITQICQKIGLEWFLSPPSSTLTPHLTGLRFNVISSRHFSFFAQTWSSGTYFSPCYCKLLLFPEPSCNYCLFSVYLASQTRSSKKPMFLFYPLTHCCIPRDPLSAGDTANICEINEYVFENRTWTLSHPIITDILVKNEIIKGRKLKSLSLIKF